MKSVRCLDFVSVMSSTPMMCAWFINCTKRKWDFEGLCVFIWSNWGNHIERKTEKKEFVFTEIIRKTKKLIIELVE